LFRPRHPRNGPRPRRPAPAWRAGLCGVLAMLLAAAAWAQGQGNDAAAKARLVGTFLRFVQWPEGTFAHAAAPLHLCVIHDSAAVGAAFGVHEGSLLAGRPVVVAMNPLPGSATCHVLFVDDSAAQLLRRPSAAALPAGQAAAAPATLSIGTADGFLATGGMVELVNVNDRYRFDIDLRALREAQLAVSPGVLKLARQVRQ
jgi:YfiR/HmsC-like